MAVVVVVYSWVERAGRGAALVRRQAGLVASTAGRGCGCCAWDEVNAVVEDVLDVIARRSVGAPSGVEEEQDQCMVVIVDAGRVGLAGGQAAGQRGKRRAQGGRWWAAMQCSGVSLLLLLLLLYKAGMGRSRCRRVLVVI